MEAPGIPERFERLLPPLVRACESVYGERLVSLAVYGSVARGVPRPDSDVDLLLVASPLPDGRMARVREFEAVEERLAPVFAEARRGGIDTRLSPLFKTPDEARRGSPLFLDMTEDARLLVDRGGFLAGELDRLRTRLEELGARRVWRASAWYWDLKPDYRWGETFSL